MADELDPTLRGLAPQLVWELFDALRKIPRPSLHEELVRNHLRALAEQHGWQVREDRAGNIVLAVPGQGAGVNAPALAIQGHMDMVCAKNPDVAHDFHSDPIELVRGTLEIEGHVRDVLRARGTTLGSDNGLGVAAALALAIDESVDRPPLELLFTADEETGMTGAMNLDAGMISAKNLLNLDAEEHGSVYLSCAGGRELIGVWEMQRESPRTEDVALRVRISGLRGGHSGVDIHERRPNAIMELLKTLSAASVELDGVRLASCDGGVRPNAIPRVAQAVLWCAPSRVEMLTEQLQRASDDRRAEMPEGDQDFSFAVERVDPEDCPAPLVADESRAMLKALASLPDGVIAWSKAIEGLVETSNNVGVIATTEHELRVVCMTRSSRDGALESVQERMQRTLEAAGATSTCEGAYPGWEADLDSPLLARVLDVYEAMFGEPPAVKAIHAGLECGILHKAMPEVHMVAFGPEIRNAHTPDEAVVLDTVEPFWRLLSGLARDLCGGRR
jgi:dipeptidase D